MEIQISSAPSGLEPLLVQSSAHSQDGGHLRGSEGNTSALDRGIRSRQPHRDALNLLYNRPAGEAVW